MQETDWFDLGVIAATRRLEELRQEVPQTPLAPVPKASLRRAPGVLPPPPSWSSYVRQQLQPGYNPISLEELVQQYERLIHRYNQDQQHQRYNHHDYPDEQHQRYNLDQQHEHHERRVRARVTSQS